MSDSTIHQLGNAELPADLFTETLANGFGLGEYPDMQYGMGSQSAVVLQDGPTTAPAVPDGLAKGSAEDLDLRSLIAETVPDLDWLDASLLEQDPARLPKNPTDVIPELVDAWSSDGPSLTAQTRDLSRVRYEESLKEGSGTSQKASVKQMREVASKAMRRSVMGHDIATIIREAQECMGEEAARLEPLLKMVLAEHGLAGNVFIRAAAYPKYGSGQWGAHLRRYARDARYVVVSERDLKNATWIQNGRCSLTGKFAVTKVPWEEAVTHYKSRLAGRSPSRTGLRSAFLQREGLSKKANSWLPHHTAAADRVSTEEAWKAFASYKPEVPQLRDPKAVRLASDKRAAEEKINSLVAQGVLPEVDRDRILASGASPSDQLKAAAQIAALPKVSAYQGVQNKANEVNRDLYLARLEMSHLAAQERVSRLRVEASRRSQAAIQDLVDRKILKASEAKAMLESGKSVHAILRAAAKISLIRQGEFSGQNNNAAEAGVQRVVSGAEKNQARIRTAQTNIDRRVRREAAESTLEARAAQDRVTRLKAGYREVRRAIEAGARGQVLKNIIAKTFHGNDAEIGRRMLAGLLERTGALKEPTKANYEGKSFKIHQAEARKARFSGTEARKVLSWLGRTLSEGFAGKPLDELIQRRFTARTREALKSEIFVARTSHEGGAGFVYVDASAYATLKGVKGCETGALKHRANQIPSVLEMSRCASCSLVSTRENGERVCSLYNKVLLADARGPEMDRIRSANVQVANMSRAEQTQSLFAGVYDPAEFDLQNTNLEGISPGMPETDKLAEIFFETRLQ